MKTLRNENNLVVQLVLLCAACVGAWHQILGQTEALEEPSPKGTPVSLHAGSPDEGRTDVDHLGSIPSVAPESQAFTVTDVTCSNGIPIGGTMSGVLASGTYCVVSNIIVPSDQTLTIEPSTVLRFGSNTSLSVSGQLIADADAGTEIVFTSAADVPAPGDWRYLAFHSSALTSILDHVEIGYANTGLSAGPGAKVMLKHSAVHHNSSAGIYTHTESGTSIPSGAVLIQNNQVHDNETGISLSAYNSSSCYGSYNATVVAGNDIFHNGSAGISMSSAGSVTSISCNFGSVSPATVSAAVTSNLIHENGRAGISVSVSAYACGPAENASEIQDNEIFANDGLGIALSGSASSGCVFGIIPYHKNAYLSPRISGNLIYDNGAGITASATRGSNPGDNTYFSSRIENNLVADNSGNGMGFTASSGASSTPQMLHNTIVNNGDAGIIHDPNFDAGLLIRNNIVVSNNTGVRATSLFTPPAGAVGFNDIFANTLANWSNYPSAYGTPTTNNINGTPSDFEFNLSVDPQFVGANDFHIPLSSPVVNAGTSSEVRSDIDGEPRFSPDIGFDEVPYLFLLVTRTLFSEAGGAATGRLLRYGHTASALEVSLHCSDTTELAVPLMITIPAGSNSVSFPISAVDDSFLDGAKQVELTAFADGYLSSPATSTSTFTVYDSETPSSPLSEEIRLNTDVYNILYSVAVASAPDGRFVAVWSGFGQDGQGYGVFAQRFGADGQPLGGEFQVNTHTNGDQTAPAVAMSASGSFVIVWASDGQDGDRTGVFGKRYDSQGQPQGPEFRANTTTTGFQHRPSIACDASGNFVVIWDGAGLDDDQGIFCQRYQASGQPVGGEFRVNSSPSNGQYYSHLAMLPDGGVVVTWLHYVSLPEVWAIRFDASGQRLGTEFRVDLHTPNAADNPSPHVAAAVNGEFVIVWEDLGKVLGRSYRRDGMPVTPPFHVNVTTDRFAAGSHPRVAAIRTDALIVTWRTLHRDALNSYGVYARHVDFAGNPWGEDLRVNVTATGHQSDPAVTSDASGNFVIAWAGNGPGDTAGIFGRWFGSQPSAAIVTTDANASEPGSNIGKFRVSRVGLTDDPLVVSYTLSGTAAPGIDYSNLTGTVTIPSGLTNKTIIVKPLNDAAPECPETVVVTLSPSPNYIIGSAGNATVTIADNDKPTLNVVAKDPNASEPGTNRGVFNIIRTGCTNSALNVFYGLGGTATYGDDYTNKPPLKPFVTIPKGRTNVVITVYPKDDALVEGAETVILCLSNKPTYIVGSPNCANVTIADNDSAASGKASESRVEGLPVRGRTQTGRGSRASSPRTGSATWGTGEGAVTTWEVKIRGADQGVAFLTFHEDHTLSGHGITKRSTGMCTISGSWSHDSEGQVVGTFVAKVEDKALVDGSLAANIVQGNKLVGRVLANEATAGGGSLKLRGIPASDQPDLSGRWVAEVETMSTFNTQHPTLNAQHSTVGSRPSLLRSPSLRSGFAEQATLDSRPSIETYDLTLSEEFPGVFRLDGEGAGPLNGAVIATSRDKVNAYLTTDSSHTRSLAGRVDSAQQTLTLTGVDSTGNPIRVRATRQ